MFTFYLINPSIQKDHVACSNHLFQNNTQFLSIFGGKNSTSTSTSGPSLNPMPLTTAGACLFCIFKKPGMKACPFPGFLNYFFASRFSVRQSLCLMRISVLVDETSLKGSHCPAGLYLHSASHAGPLHCCY